MRSWDPLHNQCEIPSNQLNGEIISISSGSPTVYDSDASTASIDLAILYGCNQQMETNNLNNSGISIDLNDSGVSIDTNRMRQFIEVDYMRPPTPRPIPVQNRLQNLAPVQNQILAPHFEPLVVEHNAPPPVPPPRPMNVDRNPNDIDFFRCVICMEPVIGKDPHTTPCGHTVCHADLNEWLNHYQASTCPYCRDPISYSECIRLYVI